MTKICHALVASTAKGIANEAYEILAHDDKFYAAWPRRTAFVARHWKDFIGHARASLLCMLAYKPGTETDPGGPEYLYSQTVRDAVYEAVTTEGAFKHVPQPQVPSAGGIMLPKYYKDADGADCRYGGLN